MRTELESHVLRNRRLKPDREARKAETLELVTKLLKKHSPEFIAVRCGCSVNYVWAMSSGRNPASAMTLKLLRRLA